MNLLWTGYSWEEYEYWQSFDPPVVEKINDLIKDTKRSPFKGLGKPGNSLLGISFLSVRLPVAAMTWRR